MVYITGLGQLDASSLPAAGGKAANLGVLINAALPVPDGFCVLTPAYLRVASGTALPDLLPALQACVPDDADNLRRLAAQARAILAGAPVPEEIASAIAAAYAGLGARDGPDRPGGPEPVAVRSSATAEDLPFASFAGQQDTFLNVAGEAEVLAAVRRCWASLWTDRAVAYRALNGIDQCSVAIAVVVQRMVPAAAAGVLFTANPVTGRRREAVIEAAPGLGEAVVSGAVDPDRFVVDAGSGRILERRLGAKHQGKPSLGDDRIVELARLGRRVEELFGAPQDIEFATDGDGRLWLTQSRPITTLYPVPHSVSGQPPSDLRLYLCLSLAQGLTLPITPMGLAAFRVIGSSIARTAGFSVPDPLQGPAPYAEAGQRFFVDLTEVVRSRLGRALATRVFDVMEARSAAVVRALFEDERFRVVHISGLPVIRRVGRIAVRFHVPVTFAAALLQPQEARRRAERFGDSLAARLAAPPEAAAEGMAPEGLRARERLENAQRLLDSAVFPLLPRILPVPAAGFAALGLARKLLGDLAAPAELQTVLRGLPHNVTTGMDLALWQLAGRIRRDPESDAALRVPDAGTVDVCTLTGRYRSGTLPPVLQAGLSEFLAEFGHRAVAEIDLGMPRWSEDPAHIIGVLSNYLRLADPQLAPDVLFARGARGAEAMRNELVARARSRGRLRAAAVGVLLERTRQLAGLRELPKYHLVQVLAAARREVAAAGVDIAAAGRLEAAADIFFLDLAEARRALGGADFRAVADDRRAAYELELRRRHVPRLLLSDGTEPEAAIRGGAQGPGTFGLGTSVLGTSATDTLTGSPASAGTVMGRARVVTDPVGAYLEPGEILVAPSTDPGWTPLFLTAGGLVMEMGGANSHGAVVAREYGIPAVVGVAGATERIATGQRIRVDGAAGTVTVDPVAKDLPRG